MQAWTVEHQGQVADVRAAQLDDVDAHDAAALGGEERVDVTGGGWQAGQGVQVAPGPDCDSGREADRSTPLCMPE